MVMRFGDGTQQNTCHIWREENNNKHDQLANARKRGTIPAAAAPPPLCRTAAVSLGGVARLATCGHFRLISIQIL